MFYSEIYWTRIVLLPFFDHLTIGILLLSPQRSKPDFGKKSDLRGFAGILSTCSTVLTKPEVNIRRTCSCRRGPVQSHEQTYTYIHSGKLRFIFVTASTISNPERLPASAGSKRSFSQHSSSFPRFFAPIHAFCNAQVFLRTAKSRVRWKSTCFMKKFNVPRSAENMQPPIPYTAMEVAQVKNWIDQSEISTYIRGPGICGKNGISSEKMKMEMTTMEMVKSMKMVKTMKLLETMEMMKRMTRPTQCVVKNKLYT
ncbi:unnamed protein product [Nesidiocoris tenuis]|uniref:Uncharacterized protein n=1 Tax=Nesidiocoris tenuis TaxID=355587 RepID=A0A6H5HFF0_9HEMI|nr:unnamed protein product [Nesidiocoris tenuis]